MPYTLNNGPLDGAKVTTGRNDGWMPDHIFFHTAKRREETGAYKDGFAAWSAEQSWRFPVRYSRTPERRNYYHNPIQESTHERE